MRRHPKFLTRGEGCDGLAMGSNSCSHQLLPTTSASSFQLTHTSCQLTQVSGHCIHTFDTGVWPLHSYIEISSHRPLEGLMCVWPLQVRIEMARHPFGMPVHFVTQGRSWTGRLLSTHREGLSAGRDWFAHELLTCVEDEEHLSAPPEHAADAHYTGA